jgi:elongation factor Ts
MAEISAAMVKELREATGQGMMECKKALTEAGGDLKKAEEILRIKSGAKATKLAGRVASEGAIAAHVRADGGQGALVEVNCETDFVAKDAAFAQFARAAAQVAAEKLVDEPTALGEEKLASGETLDAALQSLVGKLGEKMTLRRVATVKAQGKLGSYLHGSRIGVLVDYSGGDEALGKDLAMHIAASRPVCVQKEQVPAALIAKEREIYTAQAQESGKPENIVAKMVEGRIAKYLAEVALLGQPFVKDPEMTVEKLLAAKGARVHDFHLFIVGEGIEKKKDDFVAEVMAAVGNA